MFLSSIPLLAPLPLIPSPFLSHRYPGQHSDSVDSVQRVSRAGFMVTQHMGGGGHRGGFLVLCVCLCVFLWVSSLPTDFGMYFAGFTELGFQL